jgi:SAM-dependent methyltransferase
MTKEGSRTARLLPYDSLAAEYYDDRHTTSRNFDDTTTEAVRSLGWRMPRGLILEPGCGRGRCREFLGLDSKTVVQLDNSAAMLAIKPREDSLVRVLHDAEELPFADAQFAGVAAFLCDAFLGLNFLSEARRVLATGGLLVGTTPTLEWGIALRDTMGIDPMTTRFVLNNGKGIHAPSYLYPDEELRELLNAAGFDEMSIQTRTHTLPRGSTLISPDIEAAAHTLRCSIHDLPILCTFSASA